MFMKLFFGCREYKNWVTNGVIIFTPPLQTRLAGKKNAVSLKKDGI